MEKKRQEYDSQLLYLLVQPPILHIYCRKKEEAQRMIKIGRQCGFKDSAFRSLDPPYLVAASGCGRGRPLGSRSEALKRESMIKQMSRADKLDLVSRGEQ